MKKAIQELLDKRRKTWYVQKGQEQSGPYRLGEVQGLIMALEVSNEDLVWNEGWDDWREIFNIPELKQVAQLSDEHRKYLKSFSSTKEIDCEKCSFKGPLGVGSYYHPLVLRIICLLLEIPLDKRYYYCPDCNERFAA